MHIVCLLNNRKEYEWILVEYMRLQYSWSV